MKRSFVNLFFAWLVVALLFSGFTFGQENVVYQETFDYPDGVLPMNWWSEGVPAVIRNGRLFVDADSIEPRVSTVWLNKEFSGNIIVTFDVLVVSSADTSNNINLFLLYSDPSGNSLIETKEVRANGNYNHYHKLNGYIFTQLANGQEIPARFRFRYNPGFKLLHEKFEYECKAGIKYRVQITVNNGLVEYRVNGERIFGKMLDAEYIHQKGLVGFRTFHTSLWWDNLKIEQLK
jgi:hypothetical protein